MATISQKGLFALFERFPDCAETIRGRFAESSTFRTICADYRNCREALRYWKRVGGEYAACRSREYAKLMLELEAEILQHLQEEIQ